MANGLLPDPKQHFYDLIGRPLALGKVYTYAAGTTTPKATYQDLAGTIPNTNPIDLDARGECVMYGDGKYRIVLKDVLGLTIWDRDNIESAQSMVDAIAADFANSADVSKGDALIGVNASFAGAVSRTQHAKNLDTISTADFGAVGDGVADDTAKFSAFEAGTTGQSVNLLAKTYLVTAIPTANNYVNGSFKVGATVFPASNSRALISGSVQGYGGGAGTGTGIEAAYTGGNIHVPTVSGRSSTDLYALIASQNCVSEGPSRAVNVASIYSHARGNVSGNYSSRQSIAWTPQSANLVSEECRVVGGFRGANIASIYSACENESNANIGCRNSSASSRNGVNIACDNGNTGRGNRAFLIANVSGGVLQSVSIAVGNDGVTTFPGLDYQVGDPLVFFDTLAPSPVFPVVTVGSVDANGAITGFNYTSMGSGMSDGAVLVKVDNGTGDFSANLAAIGSKAQALTTVNIAQGNGLASNIGAGNYSGTDNIASGTYSVTLGSQSSSSTNDRAIVIGGSGAVSSGALSVAIGANLSQAVADGAVVTGRRTINNQVRSIALGDNGAGSASTANRKFHALSNGNVQASGTFSGSTVFTDYAEFFENVSSGVIPLGTLVALSGRKVRATQQGDKILGVVSGTALIVAGDSPFTWSGRYQTGEFGNLLYQDTAMVKWASVQADPEKGIAAREGYDGTVDEAAKLFGEIPADAERYSEPHLIENPDYDSTVENVPRSERPDEWTCVGLLGQVHVRVDASVQPGDYVAAGADGVGTKSEAQTNMLCMEVRQAFDAGKGYAVGFCLLR